MARRFIVTRLYLDSQRTGYLMTKARGAELGSDDRRYIAAPIVSALGLMDPQTAHTSVDEMLNAIQPPSPTGGRDSAEQATFRLLGDMAMATSVRIKRTNWDQFAAQGQRVVDRIIEYAIERNGSPIGHEEARAGAVKIVRHFGPSESVKLRERLFQQVMKGDPRFYGTVTLTTIASGLPDKLTKDQVGELSRAWDITTFTDMQELESVAALPGKLPDDIGRAWLDRFFVDCLDAPETFYPALKFAAEILPPRVNAAMARQFLLGAMSQAKQRTRYETEQQKEDARTYVLSYQVNSFSPV